MQKTTSLDTCELSDRRKRQIQIGHREDTPSTSPVIGSRDTIDGALDSSDDDGGDDDDDDGGADNKSRLAGGDEGDSSDDERLASTSVVRFDDEDELHTAQVPLVPSPLSHFPEPTREAPPPPPPSQSIEQAGSA